MKKTIRRIIFINLSVVICMLLCVNQKYNTVSEELFSCFSCQIIEDSVGQINSELYNNNTPAESSINSLQLLIPSFIKKPHNEFSWGLFSFEKNYFNILNQYVFYSENILIRILHSIIIFPFHSFW